MLCVMIGNKDYNVYHDVTIAYGCRIIEWIRNGEHMEWWKVKSNRLNPQVYKYNL